MSAPRFQERGKEPGSRGQAPHKPLYAVFGVELRQRTQSEAYRRCTAVSKAPGRPRDTRLVFLQGGRQTCLGLMTASSIYPSRSVAAILKRMETSEAELRRMRLNLERRASVRRTELALRLKEARDDFERIVDHVWQQYQPKRIYQWGSLIEDGHFSERSDIDIAVEGIRGASDFLAILRDAQAMTRFPVDVVQIETIHPAYAESIRARGRIVRER